MNRKNKSWKLFREINFEIENQNSKMENEIPKSEIGNSIFLNARRFTPPSPFVSTDEGQNI